MNPVLQRTQPPMRLVKVARRAAPLLTLRAVGYGYRPGRSLGLSILAHLLALLAIVLCGRYGHFGPAMVVKPQWKPTRSASILVLPTLAGGREGSGEPGGGEGNTGERSWGVRARSRRGSDYTG